MARRIKHADAQLVIGGVEVPVAGLGYDDEGQPRGRARRVGATVRYEAVMQLHEADMAQVPAMPRVSVGLGDHGLTDLGIGEARSAQDVLRDSLQVELACIVDERTRCWLRGPGGGRLGWAPAAVDVARCVPVG